MDENKKIILAALVIMLGGNAGAIFNYTNPPVVARPDPFTGTDGLRLEAKLTKDITDLKERVRVNELHIEELTRRQRYRDDQARRDSTEGSGIVHR